MKKCLIIDNYDSFTTNLIHLLKMVRPEISFIVLRNNDSRVFSEPFDILVISPGPMTPRDTGLINELFYRRIIPQKIPVLGVCLGHQFIAEYFGGVVSTCDEPIHGSTVEIRPGNDPLFRDFPTTFLGARYNSLEVKETGSKIDITATSVDGMIMGIAHKTLPIVGVQFHPESFITEHGQLLVENFFRYYANV